MASLIIVAGKSRGHFFHVVPPQIVVGRDEQCDIQVIDELVSRRHFEVRCEEGKETYELVDLKSSNGTFIADEKIDQRDLKDGDVISVGDSKILFTTQEFPDRDTAMNFFKIRGQHGKSTLISHRDELEQSR
ncbi:MAG: FHA domain-containing protein [Planctomycetota bacterium]